MTATAAAQLFFSEVFWLHTRKNCSNIRYICFLVAAVSSRKTIELPVKGLEMAIVYVFVVSGLCSFVSNHCPFIVKNNVIMVWNY